MNIELLKRLRTRFLRMRHEEHFNMEVVAQRTACGTAMCIAGHALDLQGYKFHYGDGGGIESVTSPNGRTVKYGIMKVAAKEMGLKYRYGYYDKSDAYQLFHDFSLRTPKDAAARIQELIESAGER